MWIQIAWYTNGKINAYIYKIKKIQKIKQINILGFEPFDTHHMKTRLVGTDLRRIFDLIYNKSYPTAADHNKQIKQIYQKYTTVSVPAVNKSKSVGFKMRPRDMTDIIPTLKKNGVVVFVLIRRDIARQAVSMCSTNRLQFDLKAGKIEQNPKHTINLRTLDRNIKTCKHVLKQKQYLINMLKKQGISVHPIYYEEFCKNKLNFFKTFLTKIDVTLSDSELKKLATSQIPFKKVHDNEIKKFVINYTQVVSFFKQHGLTL